METKTIKIEETELTVNYEIKPGEPMTFDDPGCPQEIEINRVMIGEIDFTILADVYGITEKIEEILMEGV